MAKYIDAEAVKRMVSLTALHGLITDTEQGLLDLIDEIPAADVEPVRHGRWIIKPDGYYPYCSECKQEPAGGIMTDYCPHCGVHMDEEVTE